jgi:hypothetical protein
MRIPKDSEAGGDNSSWPWSSGVAKNRPGVVRELGRDAAASSIAVSSRQRQQR